MKRFCHLLVVLSVALCGFAVPPFALAASPDDLVIRRAIGEDACGTLSIAGAAALEFRPVLAFPVERAILFAGHARVALTMMMMDIDNFKVVNDTRGQSAGDLVLQEVARLIRDAVRSVDSVGRVGGQEFAAVLVEMDEAQALEAAERVRCAVESADITIHEGVPVQVTISIGLSHLHGRDANFDTLLNEADKAMYAAKGSGRNRVMVYGRM